MCRRLKVAQVVTEIRTKQAQLNKKEGELWSQMRESPLHASRAAVMLASTSTLPNAIVNWENKNKIHY